MNIPLTIRDTQKGLINKEYSAVNLVDTYLGRIKKLNSDLNIFLTVTDEIAYKKAKQVDKLISDFGDESAEKYPLLGVTLGHKDIFMTKGVRTTAGAKLLGSYIPTYSSTVVDRLENAGSIMLGKLNCDAWAHGSSGENSDFGPTKNPWNKEFTPGGSSSGSGAALSANLAVVATGTDTCGSVRLPASYNHLVALKPTYGAISRYGVIAMASSLDTVGLMGRSIEDVETVFNVVKGPDGFDSTVKQFTEPKSASRFKLGIPKEFLVGGLDDEVEKNLHKAIDIFKKMGVEIIDISLPSTEYGISTYYIIQPAEVSSNLNRFDGVRYGEGRDTFGDEAKRRIMLGTYVLSAGYYDAFYLTAMKVRSKIINEVNEAFKKVDALIAPVAPTPPFKLGERSNDPLKMYLTDVYAALANLSGIPSLALPTGFTDKGLPLGVQIMGPRFSEQNLFQIGKAYHEEVSYVPKVAI